MQTTEQENTALKKENAELRKENKEIRDQYSELAVSYAKILAENEAIRLKKLPFPSEVRAE